MGHSDAPLQVHARIAADRGIVLSKADLEVIDSVHATAAVPGASHAAAVLAGRLVNSTVSTAVLTYMVPPLWRFRDDRCAVPTESWRELFAACAYTHDFAVARRPRRWRPYTLYRGATAENRHGLSWTGDIEQARYFARHRQAPGADARVWRCRVPADRVLARIVAMSWEDEYVADVRGFDVTEIG